MSIVTKVIEVEVSDKNLMVEVERKIVVTVDGGRGPSGGLAINADWDSLGGVSEILNKPTKTSEFINDGESGSPFVTHEDLPSNITLFATNASSNVGGYFKLVSTLDDTDYNDVAVDINTGEITATNQLIASLIADPNLFVGNPGIINITTIGEIKRISGSGRAVFYFELYKRNGAGVESLISTSNNTTEIQNVIYEQFSATALLNNGSFLSTDRLVLKFYGSKVGGGSDPTFNFLFGGMNPVRTSIPVPVTVVPVENTRLLYVSEITRAEIDGTITKTDLLNTTGKTFTWDTQDGVSARLTCNDASFLAKLINIVWYQTSSASTTPKYYVQPTDSTIKFDVEEVGSTYRCTLEFFNF